MYNYEEKEEFEEAMRSKVSKVTWLDSIYKLKEKWAECYMLDAFTLGMRSTQLSESLNNALKGHLKSDLDLIRFLQRVDHVVGDKREKELQAEFESRKKLPMIMIRTPMLTQASKIYTPAIFEVFQGEYQKSLAAFSKGSNGNNEFIIAVGSVDDACRIEEERNVIINPSDQIVSCSCRLFQRIGLLCRHALKALDLVNIKLLPERYILKRWTRGAKSGIIQDMQGRDVVEDPKKHATLRYRYLCQKFLPLASRTADFEDCYTHVEQALHDISKQVEDKIRETSNAVEKPNVQAPLKLPEIFANVSGLKKKDRKSGSGSKRSKNWVDKLSKRKKKKGNTSQSVVQEGESINQMMEAQVLNEKNTEPPIHEYQDYEAINAYAKVLMSSDGIEVGSNYPLFQEFNFF